MVGRVCPIPADGWVSERLEGARKFGAVTSPHRAWAISTHVARGVWDDGFIHAGNLAYMTILALFPFFVVVAAIFSAVGEASQRAASVDAMLGALPPVVASVLMPVARDVIDARHGWLLWVGAGVGLWTVSSLIETIRDILRRAYGCSAAQTAWWHYRILASGMIVLAVVALLASLYLQVAISTAQGMIAAHFPEAAGALGLSRTLPAAVLFGAIYLLFLGLTPGAYRARCYPKWPGALLVTVWWGVVSIVLPVLLRFVFKYNLTYGSLAGVMISLFFFWLVGLGMVTGAELNAALARTRQAHTKQGCDAILREDTMLREDEE